MGIDSNPNALPENTDVTDEVTVAPEVIEQPQEQPVEKPVEKEKVFDSHEILKLNNLAESVGFLATTLANRDREGLSPLIENREIGAFYSLATDIQEISISNSENVRADLEEKLKRLLYVLGQFGQAQQPRVLREDTDSLRRLSFKMGEFMDVCLDLKSFQGGKKNKDFEPTILLLIGIMDKAEKIKLWLGKKRSILEERSGRRW